MATKRTRKRLVAQIRLADGSIEERTSFKSISAAREWAEEHGAEITNHRWQQVTRWRGRYTDLTGKRPEAFYSDDLSDVSEPNGLSRGRMGASPLSTKYQKSI